jgi:hypothetical protein
MELVPVTMLEELMPVIIRNLTLLRQVQRDREVEERVLMVPAVAGAL